MKTFLDTETDFSEEVKEKIIAVIRKKDRMCQ